MEFDRINRFTNNLAFVIKGEYVRYMEVLA